MKVKQKLALRYMRARLNILALVSPRKAAVKAFRIFGTPQQRVPQKGRAGQRASAGQKGSALKKGSADFDQGEPLSFRLEGHTVRGHRWLPHPTEPPLKKVLIAHGFESAARNFEGYIGVLLKKGYEVLAFDAPAHGASGGKRISLPVYVDILKTIEQNYGPIHSFMGHSLGGLALALYLEKTPHDASDRLVLIAPAVEMTKAVETFAHLMRLPVEVRTELDEYIQEFSGHPFSWFSLRRALNGVQAGVLYLQDEGDRITPLEDALAVKKDDHPNIRFVFTLGLGHRKIYRDPEIMQQIVAFL